MAGSVVADKIGLSQRANCGRIQIMPHRFGPYGPSQRRPAKRHHLGSELGHQLFAWAHPREQNARGQVGQRELD
jgi:hypothetical protein